MSYHSQTIAALRVYQGIQRDRFRPFSDADVRDCLEFDTAETVEAGYRLARERGLARARHARAAMRGTGKACESYMMELAQAQFDMARARDYRRTMLAALEPAPAMVAQPCQQQQANAGPVPYHRPTRFALEFCHVAGDVSADTDAPEGREIDETGFRHFPACTTKQGTNCWHYQWQEHGAFLARILGCMNA